jgi:SAM-dependent methyltransferase
LLSELNHQSLNRTLTSYQVFTDEDLSQYLFEGREAEFCGYVRESAERFQVILRLVERELERREKLRILELGAAPFGLTALLLSCWGNRIELTCGVRTPEIWPGSPTPPEERRYWIQTPDRLFEVPAWQFNVERDAFPFQAGCFDLVLCTQVIEMLVHSPTHMLVEIHRVLKDRGTLIVNTPNALKIQQLFKHLVNRSPQFPYSGYGPNGRPNRLYTEEELRSLLHGCGYEIIESGLATLLRSYLDRRKRLAWKMVRAATLLPVPYLVNKRDQIFAVARAVGEARAYYPGSLYVSRYGP